MSRKPKKISEFDVKLGAVVRSKRKKLNLSQSAVAETVGIPMSNYQRREDGTVEITVSELERIASVVKVAAAKLVEEALDDYGGLAKLLAEYGPVSEPAANVTADDEADYVGHVKPDYDLAADENPRTAPKD